MSIVFEMEKLGSFTFTGITKVETYSTGKMGGRIFEAVCKCGQIKWIRSSAIKLNKVSRCVCQPHPSHKVIAAGTRINSLTITGKFERRRRKGANNTSIVYWECLCNCGNLKWIDAGLLGGKSKQISCGCLRNQAASRRTALLNRKKNIDPMQDYKSFYREYKHGAELRELSWDITLEDFIFIGSSLCFYCGKEAPLTSPHKRESCRYNVKFNGVDRKDSLLGYSKENCVGCCKDHNIMKMANSVEKFVELCRSVVKHWEGKDQARTLR